MHRSLARVLVLEPVAMFDFKSVTLIATVYGFNETREFLYTSGSHKLLCRDLELFARQFARFVAKGFARHVLTDLLAKLASATESCLKLQGCVDVFQDWLDTHEPAEPTGLTGPAGRGVLYDFKRTLLMSDELLRVHDS